MKNVRADIERMGILVDEEIKVVLRKMMYAGRNAIEQGLEPKDLKEYLEAAANIHKVVRERQRSSSKEGALPFISYKPFIRHKKRIQSLNLKIKKMKRASKGLRRLVYMANNKAKSEHEFEYFLKEIEWLLR
ncbi:MAG: hypothetical protein ACE5IJ_05015 [Thermoplasmata archaeon]